MEGLLSSKRHGICCGMLLILVAIGFGCGDDPEPSGVDGGSNRIVSFVDGDSYAYGEVSAGSTSSHSFELRTADNAQVEKQDLSLGQSSYFTIGDSDCGDVIEASCEVEVNFSAPQQGGYSNTLRFDYRHNGNSGTVLIVLSAEGV